MKIFEKQDGSFSPIKAAAVGLTALFGAYTAYDTIYILPQKEVAIETMFGKVVHVENDPGPHIKTPFLVNVIPYPLYRQSFAVDSTSASLRMGDQTKVEGDLVVDYVIDATKPVENLYIDLRGDMEDIEHALLVRAKDSAVVAFGKFRATDLTTKIDDISSEMKIVLQHKIDEQNWPFKVLAVTSNGAHLTPDSEAKLQGVMEQEQQLAVLKLRERNAEEAKKVLTAEGQAMGNLYNSLATAGVPADQIPTMICLKMANDDHKIQEQFAPGCFADATRAVPAVNVDALLANAKAAPAAVPAPGR